MTITKTLFWASAALLADTPVGYPLGLAAVAPFRDRRRPACDGSPDATADALLP